jgi:hypothetical protein
MDFALIWGDVIANILRKDGAVMPTSKYTIGVDYGTLSGRAVVVDISDGTELGSAVFEYPNAVMDQVLNLTGEKLPPEWALQDPNDYVEVLKHAVPEAVRVSGIDLGDVDRDLELLLRWGKYMSLLGSTPKTFLKYPSSFSIVFITGERERDRAREWDRE